MAADNIHITKDLNLDREFTLGLIEVLPISKLRPSNVPIRPSGCEIDQLALSIKEKGLLQPVIVRPKDDYFEVIAGNRRFEACKSLRWRNISCHVVELNDKDAFEVALVENIQRETMNPLEEAESFKRYILEFGWGSVSELARRIGKSPSHISKRITMLNLPDDVLGKIKSLEIQPSLAEELTHAGKESQSKLAELVVKRHLTVRQIREIINDSLQGFGEDAMEHHGSHDATERTEKGYDKAIAALKITLNKLGGVIEDLDDDWIAHETLMQHKNAIHAQIDILIKEKKMVHLLGHRR